MKELLAFVAREGAHVTIKQSSHQPNIVVNVGHSEKKIGVQVILDAAMGEQVVDDRLIWLEIEKRYMDAAYPPKNDVAS